MVRLLTHVNGEIARVDRATCRNRFSFIRFVLNSDIIFRRVIIIYVLSIYWLKKKNTHTHYSNRKYFNFSIQKCVRSSDKPGWRCSPRWSYFLPLNRRDKVPSGVTRFRNKPETSEPPQVSTILRYEKNLLEVNISSCYIDSRRLY